MPNTSSPGRNLLTFLPRTSTTPAMSEPIMGFFGARKPKPARRIG